MSYDIYIGNAELEAEWTGDEENRAEWVVPGLALPEAPNKPDMTGQGNACHPGYMQWSEFCSACGLDEVFFARDGGLMARHPGITALTKEHLEAFETAAARYATENPGKKAGACQCHVCRGIFAKLGTVSPLHDASLDFNFYRLEWLVWWTRWALENCERPAIYNR